MPTKTYWLRSPESCGYPMTGFSKFIRDRNGGIAINFGLTILPLMFAVGTAVDIGNLTHAKRTVQDALDSAALSGVLAQDKADYEKELLPKMHLRPTSPEPNF